MKKIDLFAHICPPKFIDAFAKMERGISWDKIAGDAPKTGGQALQDINKRLQVMDRYEDYVQVLVPVGEVIEPYFGPEDTAQLTRVFNDATAEIVAKHPDRFVGAVATLSMNNMDAALKEIDRTITELGFKGILMHTPVFGYEKGRPLEAGLNYATAKALDSPEFMPIYESMSKHNLPIWIHPCGAGGVPVYSGDKRGKFMLFHMLGWPLESAMTMSRLVCSGVLAKYPNLKFITHHCGSGIVPVLAGRIDDEFDIFTSTGTLNWDKLGIENPFKTKHATDYFRMFYADTVLGGHVSGLMCGYDFFGAEHIIFGTDFPFDLASGDKCIKRTIDSVYKMDISDTARQLIFEGNAKRILRLGTT